MVKVETLLGAIQKKYNLKKKFMFIYGDLNGYPVKIEEGFKNYISTLHMFITTELSDAKVEQIKQILERIDGEEQTKKVFSSEMKSTKLYNKYKIESYFVNKDSVEFNFITTNANKFKEAFFDFIDYFFKILDEIDILKSDHCPVCGKEIEKDKNWYLVDYKVYHAHEKCIDALNEKNEDENKNIEKDDVGTYFNGIVGAIIGAILGALIYIWVGVIGNYFSFFTTPFIAFFSTLLYRKFNGKRSKNKKYILTPLILLVIVLAEISRVVLTVAIEIKKYWDMTYMDYLFDITRNVIMGGEYRNMLLNIILGSIFAIFALFTHLKTDAGELNKLKIKKLS